MSQIELNKIEKNKGLVLEAFDTLFNLLPFFSRRTRDDEERV